MHPFYALQSVWKGAGIMRLSLTRASSCVQVYASPLQDGSRAVVLLNRHTLATQYPVSELFVDWTWLGFPSDAEVNTSVTPVALCPKQHRYYQAHRILKINTVVSG
jgi:hypothetical protein